MLIRFFIVAGFLTGNGGIFLTLFFLTVILLLLKFDRSGDEADEEQDKLCLKIFSQFH
jgi:hypothetical protein